MGGFMQNASNWIDLTTVLPLVIPWTLGYLGDTYDNVCKDLLLVVVPVQKLLRLARRFHMVQLLVSAFKDCLQALPVMLYTMAIIACIFTTVIFMAEDRETIETVSESAWLVLSTMTTVGFGDVV